MRIIGFFPSHQLTISLKNLKNHLSLIPPSCPNPSYDDGIKLSNFDPKLALYLIKFSDYFLLTNNLEEFNSAEDHFMQTKVFRT